MKSTVWLALLTFIWRSASANLKWDILNCKVVSGECPNKDVSFWLYSNSTRENPILLNPLDLNPRDFQPPRPLKILIHGYTGHRDFAPNSFIRPVLLDHEDVYVISIDYGPLVPEPCYLTALQNLPLVSRCLAQLINNLVDRAIVPNDQIHLIGFSLGGQVAGQTANYVKRKLKRITGLDPAMPFFILVKYSEILDEGDADFVDVIHTDVLRRGVLFRHGHVDFYPNFGITQPGCMENGILSISSCNHERAPRFYAESINSTVGFWGRQCSSKLMFLYRCPTTGDQALMGYHVSDKLRGSFYLQTASKSPFALGKMDNRRTLAKFHLNFDHNEIDKEYEPQLETFLELEAVKVVEKMDEASLDKQLNWIDQP
ncbi:pancreatic triacylglycerol lipase-like [Drosophila teissieri]|uniref:pancreatic triacylglycerol lipase-like n=1 Tax=Drosophila teissieri TaxID=7243 RepID=UPI001CBA1DA6|nr:pancreatic triacylglycerol lipase-like [Drosophila teissieri]